MKTLASVVKTTAVSYLLRLFLITISSLWALPVSAAPKMRIAQRNAGKRVVTIDGNVQTVIEKSVDKSAIANATKI